MKKFLFFILIFFSAFIAKADHLKGGFFTYEYLGPGSGPNTLKYHITLTVYMVCNPKPEQIGGAINFSFYNADTRQFYKDVAVPITQQYELKRSHNDPCIIGDQSVCYYIVVYDLPGIDLPVNQNGYTVAYQRCCRIININNIQAPSNNVGNTYAIAIPGKGAGQNAEQNKSAEFLVNDTAVVCGGNYFQLGFQASDRDGDSLSYSFCNAWTGGTQNDPAPGTATAPLAYIPVQYTSIPYASGYSGTTPLGSKVTIDPGTGIISGIAPSQQGEYVVTVCVTEYRNGVAIAYNRKELHITVKDCNPIRATLNPQYVNCGNFTFTFSNNTPTGVQNSFWDFGVPGDPNNNSTLTKPTFTYPDTGTFVLKLVVNRNLSCPDSTTAPVKVYPGFFPNFTYNGICVNKPTHFLDSTRTVYGFVNTWNWNFGDPTSQTNTSPLQNPFYTYAQSGTYHVQFIVGNNKGCIDTVHKDITILDKPPLSVAFNDTLICRGDNVQLHAIGNGNFSWTPTSNITNANTPDPTVSPASTQTYSVQLDDNGCINNDTVRVRVVTVVSLQAKADTTICLTDSLQLFAVSDGLRFQWSPSADFSDPNAQNPFVHPQNTSNKYTVTAIIGSCNTTSSVTVKTVPYPIADAGSDTTICYSASAQLHGKIAGSSFSWSPTNTLTNFNTLDPIATPVRDTSLYVLTVRDTIGCPKPGFDTVLVVRLPKIYPFAGKDTSVIAGQPLQFNATGGTSYNWIPSIGLNNPNIHNPIGRYDGSFEYITYRVIVKDIAGCADSAFIKVHIFKTEPRVFVPTAFTPNGDGKNDVFRPIAVGIDKILYFRVFNRWGQLVFETTENGKGWDGKINGKEQATGVFVWLVKAVDYLGNDFFAKGTTTLIR